MFFRKRKRLKNRLIAPYKRSEDIEPFQVYEILEEEEKKRYNKQHFVSPIFGVNVKDDVVIPVGTERKRDLDRDDAFRAQPRLTKDERLKKYGTLYPEFDLVRGKNLKEVLDSQGKKRVTTEEGTRIESAEIIAHGQSESSNTVNIARFAKDEETSFDTSEPVQNDSIQDEVVQDEKPQMIKEKPMQEEETLEEVPAMNTKEAVKTKLNEYSSYQLPSLTLLSEPSGEKVDLTESIERQKMILNTTFEEFGVGARVYKHTQGPTVTRFEIALEKGVKINKVTNLQDNIKMNLAAKEIRLEAPIPGKTTVGIEVPNEHPETVHFIDIVKKSQFKNAAQPLTFGLGLDIDGQAIYASIKSMPHGLIAGQTGSGKSVCVNTLLLSLLLKYKPSDLKLVLIDPKMVELTAYNDIPHLITPVITDAKAATAALKWLVDEMERRFQSFADTRVRDVEGFNEKMKERGEKLPYIVVVIDELADLMMVSSQHVEESIARLTQKARACGIHLIVATQRPSTDVIKGTIKSNIPTRIAFSVSSHVDSQTILDASGAEKLLGKGDMLFMGNGQNKVRLQGAFVPDEDIERVADFIRSQAKANYLFTAEQLVKNATKTFEMDDLLDDVARYVVMQQECSINKISKEFSIGFNRASNIVQSLESAGIVSENQGTKAREVLVELDELEDLLEQLG